MAWNLIWSGKTMEQVNADSLGNNVLLVILVCVGLFCAAAVLFAFN